MKLLTRYKKISVLFLLFFLLGVIPMGAFAHTPYEKELSQERYLSEVLEEIGETYQVFFNYESELIKGIKVNFELKKGERLTQAVDRLLVQTHLKYELTAGKFIIIFKNDQRGKKKAKKIKRKIKQIDKLEKRGEISVRRNNSDPRIRSLNIIESILTRKADKSISGIVTDADGNPLPGATVQAKGTTQGALADAKGHYQLSVPEDVTTLVISYIGYVKQEITIGGRSVINVSMVQSISTLDEVIVVGYGSVKKSDLTGSVVSISAEELTAYPAIDAIQALQGRAAGVSVQSTNGQPGSGYRIQIRGNTSVNASSDPLIVVDGFVGGVMPPPEDIQSMEILKDASATAIYGSRGANGVIMVTTKRGKSGAVKINFSSSWSSQEETNRLELLNGTQFAQYINEVDSGFYANPSAFGQGTDWQDQIYRKGGIQNYQLSVAGGSDKVNYYLSGTVYDQKGVVKKSDYQRYSVTSNLDIQATNSISFGANLFARKTKQQGPRTQEGGYFQPGAISSAYKFMPTQGIRDESGSFSVSERGDPIDNPLALATELENEAVSDLFQGNIYGEIKLFEGLKFRSSIGANISNGRTGRYYPRTLERGGAANGEAWLGFSKNTDILTEHYLTYTKNIGGVHAINVTAGYSYQSFRSERINLQTTGYISDSFSWWNIGASTDPPLMSSSLVFSEISSWYGRINYSIQDKYLFTFNARQDGSSRFAKNNKWAFFPSGAFAWNISNEDFMSSSSLISHLKLRLSYGKTGNQAIRPYQSLATFTNVLTTVEGSQIPAIRPGTVANNNLTWETTTQSDVGIDLEMLEGRIGVTMDYYIMETTDLLFNVPLPQYSGFTRQLQNVGTMQNRGFEFALNTRNFIGDFTWSMNANITFNRNEITQLIENDKEGNDILYSTLPLPGSGQTQLLREGQPTAVFWGYVYEGVLQSADDQLINGEEVGGESFRDLNGDGMLTDEDRTIIGSPHPKFTWGWSNDFSYKGFDLNIFVLGSQGGQMINYTLMELGVLNGRFNATTDALNRWTPSNTNTDIPAARASRGHVMSDRWVEDASYLRLKNISLGYNIPKSLLGKIKISSARLYISGQNLLTLTDYQGLDPEVAYRNNNSNLGLDYGSYPNVKSYTAGLNIGF